MNTNSGMAFEGIGDEVVQFVVLMMLLILPIVFFFEFNFIRNNVRIHLESTEVVAEVRNNLSNANANNAITNDNGQITPERHYATIDEACPICLAHISYPVETNCGHMFCAICIITYWTTGRWNGAIRCPTCRQQVTLLLRCFNSEPVVEPIIIETIDSIRQYNRLYSGQPTTWRERIRDVPTLLRHMMPDLFSFSGLLFMFRIRIILCFLVTLLYLLSPLDLFPEAVFGLFGFVDDILIILLTVVYSCLIYRHIVLAREAMGL